MGLEVFKHLFPFWDCSFLQAPCLCAQMARRTRLPAQGRERANRMPPMQCLFCLSFGLPLLALPPPRAPLRLQAFCCTGAFLCKSPLERSFSFLLLAASGRANQIAASQSRFFPLCGMLGLFAVQ